MPDGRKNNGGKRPGAGRKSKAEELKVSAFATEAIKEEYGSQSEFWALIAKKARDSNPHLKHLLQYAYGKPQDSVDLTSGGDKLQGFEIVVRNESETD